MSDQPQLEVPPNGAPFFHVRRSAMVMAMWSLSAVALLVACYSWRYDPGYFGKFIVVLGFGIGIEIAYVALAEGRAGFRSGSSMLTAGLLAASIPPSVPFKEIFFALIAGIVLAKLSASSTRAIALNPALVARLFLMISYPNSITNWTTKAPNPDELSTATPLELFHEEGLMDGIYDPLSGLVQGKIGGVWEEFMIYAPGSPGEMFAILIIVLGIILYLKGILDWRIGVSFVVSFAIATAVFYGPEIAEELTKDGQTITNGALALQIANFTAFYVLGGAVIFSAVFIANDPISTPKSKGGRIAAGIIAGILNCWLRRETQYSETIVFTFLIINLLSPTIDRIAYHIRGYLLIWRKRKALRVVQLP
jgi:electron transport complex protein RnfD